jgi:hypothetical protein
MQLTGRALGGVRFAHASSLSCGPQLISVLDGRALSEVERADVGVVQE